jgi:glycosyltransferase involved in cell wall biosynthesis
LDSWPTLSDVATAVHRTGAEVTVVQSFHADAERLLEGVRYRFVAEPGLPGRATGMMPSRLARAVRACDPDIIHINGLDFGWHTRVLCGIGVPVLAQDHASTPLAGCVRRRWGLSKVAGVAFTDAAQADPFIKKGCLRRDLRLFSVPESSTHFSAGSTEASRAQSGVHGNPAVLWVGRLDTNKDPLTILDAIEQASIALPHLQLWCCFHEEPLLREVQARLATSEELAARVHLLGRVPHPLVETLCRAADFFMLGSHREGSGYALIEAIACGVTPIVSDIPSFRRLMGEGRIGALVPVGDAAAFAEALVNLAAEPREDLRRRATVHFERELSFDAVGARLCEVYEALIRAAV